MSTRSAQQASYRQWGWISFVASLVAALLAIWLWNYQWLATTGVLLFAALICGCAAVSS